MTEVKKAVYLEPAPAKINLFLNIESKRDDGFHNIQTLFQALDLMDHLTFEIVIESGDSDLIDFEIVIDSNDTFIKQLGEHNIVAKAIEAYFSNLSDHVLENVAKVKLNIFIDKNIPIEAGLAGGSADAAATLRVLNKFFYENYEFSMSDHVLANIGLELGSDLPFCLRSNKESQLYAEAQGENFKDKKLSELSPYMDFDYGSYSQLILVKPAFGISAKNAYNLFDKFNGKKKLVKGFYNDFEAPIFADYPDLFEIRESLLESGCDYVLMSGSGSTMLGFVYNEKNIDEIYDKAKLAYPDAQSMIKTKFLTN